MELKKIIQDLKDSEQFKAWKEKNPNAKLVHVFTMIDPSLEMNYDIGYYQFEKKIMTSFTISNKGDVAIREDEEVFKREEDEIHKIDEDKIKIDFGDAIETALALQKEKYKVHEPIKKIVILQNIQQGQVWNITFITKQFSTLNFKIDSENGAVLEDKVHQIFST